MIHLPLLGGVAIGVGVVFLLNNKKTREQLEKGKEFVGEKLEQGVQKVKAIKGCMKDKSGESGQIETKDF